MAKRSWTAWLALALVACAPGVSDPPAPLAGYNLILVNVDTLRADHLGCYGYHRDTSPFIDSLAEQGVLFEQAIANSSFTRESVSSLLTGLLPSRGGSVGWSAAPAANTPVLGEFLKAAGYRSAFLSNTTMLRAAAFSRGFDRTRHLPKRWNLSGEGPVLSKLALAFIQEAGDAPFALYLHYLDPHAPYQPAERFIRRFAEERFPEPLALYEDVSPRAAELAAQGFGPGDPRFEDLVLRYDAEIAATDAALAELVRGLEAQGLADRTLLVLTADHGEEFFEHGFVEHGWTLYQESLHVPLLFWAPAALPAARVRTPVSQVDVLPSLLELLGLTPGDAELDGASLFDAHSTPPRPREQQRAQIAELLIRQRNALRSVIRGDWKYVEAHHWLEPEQRPDAHRKPPDPSLDFFGEPVRRELFHLAEDPAETRDRSDSAPEIRRELADTLQRYRVATREPRSGPGRVAPAPRLSEQELERLRALGYQADPDPGP